MTRARSIAFWTVTVLVVQENVSGFSWALFRLDYITTNLAHLGYPPYFLNVVGVGQLLCALAILAPGFERAKEWGYAGAMLNYVSAAYSHDRPSVAFRRAARRSRRARGRLPQARSLS